jgi:hypothetical protein
VCILWMQKLGRYFSHFEKKAIRHVKLQLRFNKLNIILI